MSDAINKSELMERIENDLEFLADARTAYKEDCPELIAKMREALSRQDSDALADAVHTLKGMFSNFAAHSAVEAAVKLQLLASRGQLSGARMALDALERESQRLEYAFEEILRAR